MRLNAWGDILNGIDERNIDSAIALIREKPTKPAALRNALYTAAAVAVVIAAGVIVRLALAGSPNVSAPETTSESAMGRFASYDFGGYSEQIVYSAYEASETGSEDSADVIIPHDRYDLVKGSCGGVVVNIKSSEVTDKLFPAAANECVAEVEYVAFGNVKAGENISIFTYPKSRKKDVEAGEDYFILLSDVNFKGHDNQRGYYKTCGLYGVFKINGDFTVTPLSGYEAAQKYNGLSLADLVHDLSEAFDGKSAAM